MIKIYPKKWTFSLMELFLAPLYPPNMSNEVISIADVLATCLGHATD